MTDKYFVEYTGIEVKHFRDTLLQHMDNVKKSVAERTRVNKRHMQMQESKIDTGKAVDDDLVVTESSGIEQKCKMTTVDHGMIQMLMMQISDPYMMKSQWPRVDQYPEQCQVKSPMPDSSPDNQTTNYSKQSLESENILLKNIVAQFQIDFSRMEAHCIALELKYQNQASKSGQHGQILNETSNKAKIKKEINALKPMNIELEHSVAKLRSDSYAKIQSHKTKNSNKPIDQKSHTQKPGRQIFKGHRFSPNKIYVVYEKTSPIFDLRWKPTGRIFNSVGLRWIPTGKLFDYYTSKVDSKSPHGSNVDIPNIHECQQTMDVSACTSINVQKEQRFDLSAELESLFSSSFDEYFSGENQVVSKSSAVTTADASDKRQQQPDSTSSTSTLATTVSADGNFDL
uniref:Integrase, catalytic region, zinc finger, CCHC-type, peptidase aspartic, catalytic n=1 Tax=Tanacetum cinerariifolium TaxID=118510 RepID=A0A6L2JAJ0_TANCI|nr:hypothetical protein [Tanacetum cinerariifolium]